MSVATEKKQELIPVPFEAIPLDQPLSFPIYINIAGQDICFRNKGEVLTMDRAKTLMKRVPMLLVPAEAWNWFWNEIQKTSLNSAKVNDLRLNCFEICQKIEKTLVFTEVELHKLSKCATAFAEAVEKMPDNAFQLVRKYNTRDFQFANHMVNVGAYSALIGYKHGIVGASLATLCLAGMVHDIGKLSTLRAKIDEQASKKHAEKGSEILKNVSLVRELAEVALQHHESQDGSGFPFGLHGEDISQNAKIVTIADTFDSLTSYRQHRQNTFDPQTAIKIMQSMNLKFDGSILTPAEEEKVDDLTPLKATG